MSPAPAATTGVWVALRGPLFVTLVFACSMSLLTRGYFAPLLIASGFIAWSFVPLAGIVGLTAVWWARRTTLPFSQALDRFFAGYAPWLLWLVASSVFWALSPDLWPEPVFLAWAATVIPIVIWSARIDYQFLQNVIGIEKPGRYLVLQRLVSWMIFIVIFGGGALWPGLLEELGIR